MATPVLAEGNAFREIWKEKYGDRPLPTGYDERKKYWNEFRSEIQERAYPQINPNLKREDLQNIKNYAFSQGLVRPEEVKWRQQKYGVDYDTAVYMTMMEKRPARNVAMRLGTEMAEQRLKEQETSIPDTPNAPSQPQQPSQEQVPVNQGSGTEDLKRRAIEVYRIASQYDLGRRVMGRNPYVLATGRAVNDSVAGRIAETFKARIGDKLNPDTAKKLAQNFYNRMVQEFSQQYGLSPKEYYDQMVQYGMDRDIAWRTLASNPIISKGLNMIYALELMYPNEVRVQEFVK